MEDPKAIIDIIVGVVTILSVMWAGLWFLVKKLIFDPLKELSRELRALRSNMVRIEMGFNTRLVVVEKDNIDLKEKLSALEDRINEGE